ncbi:SPP1 family predicted phage head-tail adaptor [Rhizomicrobium palustre]|uniref:SPP1 family predicted phage head-tail adaptor n=1 Tax=Rhizomicrobium palustre TaxID=189966 RepID=A0A846MVV6_9PROT|nr:phage head closure protein [Rhizomicrobium palustre]NIK87634.1 SPP1 family predicted phage head-tail adaptor [Rhizomicrobium palustre]
MSSLGKLNQRAELLAHTLQSDGGGGYSDVWAVIATVWISIAPLAAAERIGPGRLESKARHKITLRARSDLSVGQRLSTASRIFQIHAMEDAGAPIITLLCEELP